MRSTAIGFAVLIIIGFIMTYQFASFDSLKEYIPVTTPKEDFAPQILDEIKKVEEELFNLSQKDKLESEIIRKIVNQSEINRLLDTKFDEFQQLMEKSMSEMAAKNVPKSFPIPAEEKPDLVNSKGGVSAFFIRVNNPIFNYNQKWCPK